MVTSWDTVECNNLETTFVKKVLIIQLTRMIAREWEEKITRGPVRSELNSQIEIPALSYLQYSRSIPTTRRSCVLKGKFPDSCRQLLRFQTQLTRLTSTSCHQEDRIGRTRTIFVDGKHLRFPSPTLLQRPQLTKFHVSQPWATDRKGSILSMT